MQFHVKVAAWLHIICAVFVMGCVATLWVLAASLAWLVQGTFIPELIALFGKPIAIALLSVAVLELAGALAALARRTWGRWVLSGVNLPLVWLFPVGTAVAVYSFWALWFANRGPEAEASASRA